MDLEQDCGAIDWARQEFEDVELGDSRRTTRLIRMAARTAQRPGGRISDVFVSDAERQGAYDFLESPHVDASSISEAIAAASIGRTCGEPYAFVPVDGTSVTITDRTTTKDFGKIGHHLHQARGLKVLHSYVVDARGAPCGPCAQSWWTRPLERITSRPNLRPLDDRETRHWLAVISVSAQRFDTHSPGTRPWFQLDRGADSVDVLRFLVDEGHLFTVRANWNRRMQTEASMPRRYLRDELARTSLLTTVHVDLPERNGRPARRARLSVRVAYVQLDLNDRANFKRHRRPFHIVQVKEVLTTPRGEKPIEWLLLTNFVVRTPADAKLVIFGYTRRWAIEDFHKTWKSGVCGVEDTQLRRKAHVIKWATILAAVAARVERLKHLARTEPERPASTELSPVELKALVYLKRKYKKRTETIPDTTPTMATAVRWIAQMGGYTGAPSGGPPGSITIARGLERLQIVAEVFGDLDSG